LVVIACFGVVSWLLMVVITLCLGAAAKRGDEQELGRQHYLPNTDDGATILPFDRELAAGGSGRPRLCPRRT
jgi:hypothetical protein